MTETPSSTPPTPRLRPRWLYRFAYVWAGAGIAWLLVSGRLIAYFAFFRQSPGNRPGDAEFESAFLTGVLWLVFIAPLMLLAFDLGMQHTQARRLGLGIWRGLRETWRVAWQRPAVDEMAEEFAEAPEDDVLAAIVQGIVAASLPLAVFLGAVPSFRTNGGIIWVGGAGVLFGVAAYCHRRAAAYLQDEPSRWSMFRQWSLMNPERYEEAGRPFVRVQIACVLLLPFWWVGGGAFFMSRP